MSSDKINSANANTLRLERALRDAAPPTGKSSKALEQLSTQEVPSTDAVKINFNNNQALTELSTYSRSSAKPKQSNAEARSQETRDEKKARIAEEIKNGSYKPDSGSVASAVASALF